jgi:hypothetical protein
VTSWTLTNEIYWKDAPLEIIIDDAILKLMSRFKTRPIFMVLPKKCFYQWHVDAGRNTALNVEIETNNSDTYFADKGDGISDIFTDLTHVDYKEGGMHLLNTLEQHCIINQGDYRYLFSLAFFKPTIFEEVREYCIQNNL